MEHLMGIGGSLKDEFTRKPLEPARGQGTTLVHLRECGVSQVAVMASSPCSSGEQVSWRLSVREMS